MAAVSAGDACVLKTNKISQLYEISKDGVDGCKGFTSTRPPYGRDPASYGGLCNSDMLNRVACNAQEALDDDRVGSTIYACQKDGDQYIWKKSINALQSSRVSVAGDTISSARETSLNGFQCVRWLDKEIAPVAVGDSWDLTIPQHAQAGRQQSLTEQSKTRGRAAESVTPLIHDVSPHHRSSRR